MRLRRFSKTNKSNLERKGSKSSISSLPGNKKRLSGSPGRSQGERSKVSFSTSDVKNSGVFSPEHYFQIGSYTSLGDKHDSNEDRAAFETFENSGDNCCFAAVFDGHGGSRCSEHLAKIIGGHVKKSFFQGDAWDNGTEVMREVFHQIDKDYCKNALERRDFSGACATVVVCKNDDLIIGNVGDCRAVLSPVVGDPVEITVDHRADCVSENLRIDSAGGTVKDGRVMSLQPSRSFGDVDVKMAAGKDVVIASPDVDKLFIKRFVSTPKRSTLIPSKTKVRPFLVIASDGVWDFVEMKQVCATVKSVLKAGKKSQRRLSKGSILDENNEAEMCAEKIVKLAKAKGSDDDTTAVVILF